MQQLLEYKVFPVLTGMNRVYLISVLLPSSVPRTHGDEPGKTAAERGYG